MRKSGILMHISSLPSEYGIFCSAADLCRRISYGRRRDNLHTGIRAEKRKTGRDLPNKICGEFGNRVFAGENLSFG